MYLLAYTNFQSLGASGGTQILMEMEVSPLSMVAICAAVKTGENLKLGSTRTTCYVLSCDPCKSLAVFCKTTVCMVIYSKKCTYIIYNNNENIKLIKNYVVKRNLIDKSVIRVRIQSYLNIYTILLVNHSTNISYQFNNN